MSVKIEKENGKITVTSLYNPKFPAEARKIGGKWTGKSWTFDKRDEERVRGLCVQVYGTDGTPQELVDVQVRLFPDTISEQDLWALGREIIERPSRDTQVRMGTGVVLVAREFGTSGMKTGFDYITRTDNINRFQAMPIFHR